MLSKTLDLAINLYIWSHCSRGKGLTALVPHRYSRYGPQTYYANLRRKVLSTSGWFQILQQTAKALSGLDTWFLLSSVRSLMKVL